MQDQEPCLTTGWAPLREKKHILSRAGRYREHLDLKRQFRLDRDFGDGFSHISGAPLHPSRVRSRFPGPRTNKTSSLFWYFLPGQALCFPSLFGQNPYASSDPGHVPESVG